MLNSNIGNHMETHGENYAKLGGDGALFYDFMEGHQQHEGEWPCDRPAGYGRGPRQMELQALGKDQHG